MSDRAASAVFRAEAGPDGTRFTDVRHLTEVDSTNRYLVDEARAGAPEGLVAIADHQTAGRGRLGRRWEAPPGTNLLASVVLRPAVAVDQLHLCTVVVALAARSACALVAGVEPTLKWPNDLIVGERKLGGVLAESVAGAPEGGAEVAGSATARAVVVGLGVNVAWPPADAEGGVTPVPPDLARSATSLWRESGRRVEVRHLFDALLGDLDGRLDDLAGHDGRHRQVTEYRSVCATLGRIVTVSVSDRTFSGRALDITTEGHLKVAVGSRVETIAAGDVVHVRPSTDAGD